ncbi:septal ring lytic transglycosylase RlpA family protein [Nonomuraea sp. M3C6]|uniref:Probable endolytic peptidoglycan transglycosylase RlpA n=1 Tax=Nonomuraea marmarensis TaxID=3351344 RepID=A0ABW7AFY1_9ACTN
MGQHSYKPSPRRSHRWAAIAAGAVVVAAASTTAWAAIGNDSPKRTAATTPVAKPSPDQATTPNEAARQPTPETTSPEPADTTSPSDTRSPAPKPPAAVHPKPTKSAEPEAKTEATKPRSRVLSTGACGASFYGEPQMTASGERFNPSAMTAAHKTLPLGSKVRVTNPNNGDSVTVRINDRGPYVGGRCLDLSEAAFAAIGNVSSGVMRVKYEVLSR